MVSPHRRHASLRPRRDIDYSPATNSGNADASDGGEHLDDSVSQDSRDPEYRPGHLPGRESLEFQAEEESGGETESYDGDGYNSEEDEGEEFEDDEDDIFSAPSKARQSSIKRNSWESDESGLFINQAVLTQADKTYLHKSLRALNKVDNLWWLSRTDLFEKVFHEQVPAHEEETMEWIKSSFYSKCNSGIQRIRQDVRDRQGHVPRWLCAKGSKMLFILGSYELYSRSLADFEEWKDAAGKVEIQNIPIVNPEEMTLHKYISNRFSAMEPTTIAKQFYVLSALFLRYRTVDFDYLSQFSRASSRSSFKSRAFGKLTESRPPPGSSRVVVSWLTQEGLEEYRYTVRLDVSKSTTVRDLPDLIWDFAREAGFWDMWSRETRDRELAFGFHRYTLDFWQDMQIGNLVNDTSSHYTLKPHFTLVNKSDILNEIKVSVSGSICAVVKITSKKRKRVPEPRNTCKTFISTSTITPEDARGEELPVFLHDALVACIRDVHERCRDYALDRGVSADSIGIPSFYSVLDFKKQTHKLQKFKDAWETLRIINKTENGVSTIIFAETFEELANSVFDDIGSECPPTEVWSFSRLFRNNSRLMGDVFHSPKIYSTDGRPTVVLCWQPKSRLVINGEKPSVEKLVPPHLLET